MDTKETKKCNSCNTEKSLIDFYSNGTTPKGSPKYKPTCKSCSLSANRIRKYEVIQSVLEELGLLYECVYCGYCANHAALTFHHNTEEKNFELSGSTSRSRESILHEVSICDLLCQNCHHELHNPELQI